MPRVKIMAAEILLAAVHSYSGGELQEIPESN